VSKKISTIETGRNFRWDDDDHLSHYGLRNGSQKPVKSTVTSSGNLSVQDLTMSRLMLEAPRTVLQACPIATFGQQEHSTTNAAREHVHV
jgi:hypothetical protein